MAAKQNKLSTLQQACKNSILKSVGIDKAVDLRQKTEIPVCLIDFLTKEFSCQDFFIKGDDVTIEDITSGTYRATCLIDNKEVLLKSIPFDQITQEKYVILKQWGDLDIEGLQKCYVNFREKEHLYFVMHYGVTNAEKLCHRLNTKGTKLKEDTIWYMLHCVTTALSQLQKSGLAYSDLTAEKVFVDSLGHVSLENHMLHVTDPEGVMERFVVNDTGVYGLYTAPEVISGETANDASVVWALGCITYLLIKGIPAYAVTDPGNIFEVLNDIVEGNEPPKLDSCSSEDLKTLVQACMKSQASERPTFQTLLQIITKRKISMDTMLDDLLASVE